MPYNTGIQAHKKNRVLLFFWLFFVTRLNNNYLTYGKNNNFMPYLRTQKTKKKKYSIWVQVNEISFVREA